MTDSSDFDGLKSLRTTLARMPGGTDAVRLMARLGLWTTTLHDNPGDRKAFPQRFSNLSPGELSDLAARVASDGGRVLELVGILTGLDTQLRIKSKSARAAARSRIRRNWPQGTKAPTRGELEDLAEEDSNVRDIDTQQALLAVLLAQAKAVAEANALYKESVSREITLRTSMMHSRIN